jgi:hypothetical protein
MDWNQFNAIVSKNEFSDFIELDLRPFGAQQSEAESGLHCFGGGCRPARFGQSSIGIPEREAT